jgi:hypothetical protein
MGKVVADTTPGQMEGGELNGDVGDDHELGRQIPLPERRYSFRLQDPPDRLPHARIHRRRRSILNLKPFEQNQSIHSRKEKYKKNSAKKGKIRSRKNNGKNERQVHKRSSKNADNSAKKMKKITS